jgi:hypothetical protein
MWDDLTNLLNDAVINVFESVAIVGSNTLRGTFRRQYLELPSGTVGQEGTVPVFECKEADAKALNIARNSQLTIDGVSYYVVGGEPNDGWLTLILELA